MFTLCTVRLVGLHCIVKPVLASLSAADICYDADPNYFFYMTTTIRHDIFKGTLTDKIPPSCHVSSVQIWVRKSISAFTYGFRLHTKRKAAGGLDNATLTVVVLLICF